MHPYDPDSPEYEAMREAGRGPRRIPSEKGCAKTHPGLTHREWLTSGGDEHFALTVRDPAGPRDSWGSLDAEAERYAEQIDALTAEVTRLRNAAPEDER